MKWRFFVIRRDFYIKFCSLRKSQDPPYKLRHIPGKPHNNFSIALTGYLIIHRSPTLLREIYKITSSLLQ